MSSLLCPRCDKASAAHDVFKGITCEAENNPICIFYDDEGKLHHHRRIVTNYCCSNGHDWREEGFVCEVCGSSIDSL